MDTLGSIIEVIRDYLNRCVKCSKCRQGTCPWICNFLTPEASAITENADQKTTHEARAMALYEKAGCPCEQQLTFDDFIDRIDSFASKAKMPENGAELFATLRTLEEFPSRLGRMTKGARLAFADAIYSAIEHTLAALDYYYLRNGHCIKELLQQVHPSYNREEMFKLTGKIKSFTDKLIKKAKPLKWDEEAIDEQPATDPVRTATADIPTELSSPEAMRYWQRAQDAQLLDDHFHFIGTKTELTVFVATFSTALFKEIRWSPFDQWQPYRNYAKTYCEYNNRKNQKLTPKIQTIMDVFRA